MPAKAGIHLTIAPAAAMDSRFPGCVKTPGSARRLEHSNRGAGRRESSESRSPDFGNIRPIHAVGSEFSHSLESGNPWLPQNAVEGWIPAFAGMTEVRNRRLLRHMRSPCPFGGEGEEERRES